MLDRGYQYFDRPKTESNAKILNAVDEEGQIATEPVLLNPDGTKREKDEEGLFIEFETLGDRDYNVMISADDLGEAP